MAGDRVISWNQAGLSLTVYDANGHQVGIVTSATSSHSVHVARKIGEQFVIVEVAKNEFVGNDTLYFTSNNCSGIPWGVNSGDLSSDILPRAIVTLPNHTLYLPDPHGRL